ncbi:NAD(P)H-hydrate dehydratase [Sphingosinicella rhizophila]|uniref:ADP-dependent (S)-NAD(P)H-hydrate dehydratase n=1 Tax=Sphingosinicella rhizophila TaxID=3050082 RepID=A0ABU3QC13_9SPHN|nr:NAD(P)H-hydrate dehydratase [Sphingosinicella sp. GR2756]MDT9600929.1 NAD(P)H-hydrate dehydratase [Sphingosinicella sp. GR2756]
MNAPARLDRRSLREFPLPIADEDGDKEDRGRLLVIGGSRELAGAVLLAALGGLRAGAGKLQVATAASIAIPLSVAIPEARVIGCDEDGQGCLAPASGKVLRDLAREADAVTIGCGLQHGAPLDALLESLFADPFDSTLVLDAAALGSLAPLKEALRGRKGSAILLPHSREMARLLDCDHDVVVADPLAAVRHAASLYDAVAVIKGPCSYIAVPEGRAFRFEGGGIGLATSGSGDVLAGIVGGLCARGADALTATLWGVYLHGESGRKLAKDVGRIGFLARELLDPIPGLLER